MKGLVATLVAPFAAGSRCNMMSPMTFIKNPVLWVELISKVQANYAIGPDFSFRLTAKKFTKLSSNNQSTRNSLDLSCIGKMLTGAEPINADTKELFEKAFLPYGLRQDWFSPCYGMAECVVMTSYLPDIRLSNFQASTYGKSLVAVGHRNNMPHGQEIKIVCPGNLSELEDGKIGEIWISGPSVTSGYYGRPELTKEIFNATLEGTDVCYLRTGDLGFFEEGYLYICGRKKDLIIVNGVNYYPQDIEHVVDSITGVRPGCVAAFSSDEMNQSGGLEIVFEIRKNAMKDVEKVVNDVHQIVTDEIGLVPSRLVAIQERTICKTTSGKIQRRKNRDTLHSNDHEIIHEFSRNSRTNEPTASRNGSSTNEAIEKRDFESIVSTFLGNEYNGDTEWVSHGLSSMASVQLTDAITDSYPVILDINCFDEYKTPNLLKDFVLGSQCFQLRSSLKQLQKANSTTLSWITAGVMQFILSLLLLLIFSLAVLIPAWYTDKYVSKYLSCSLLNLQSDATLKLAFFPAVIPSWMLSYSLEVIVLKWLCVWKYKEVEVKIPSYAYLQWWFVDRAVELWEKLVGRFLLGTIFINLFYYMMGAKIHYSVTFDSFIREFDLVSIGHGSSIKHTLSCRKFGVWEDETTSLSFRPIAIEENCVLKGMVSIGASIRSGCHIEKLSVVPEGAIVRSKSRVMGNPGIIVEENIKAEQLKHSLLMLNFFKVGWLVIELYHFEAISLLGFYLWGAYLFDRTLLLWCCVILWTSCVSVLTNLVLKWTFIGKRKPGPFQDTTKKLFLEWAVDWHYANAMSVLLSFSFNSRIWNIILRMHGLNIDYKSKIFPDLVPPSTFDLLKIRKSFLSVVSFDPEKDGSFHEIDITESSIGYNTHIGGNSVKISGVVVPPMSFVRNNTITSNTDVRRSTNRMQTNEVLIAFFFLANIGLYVLALVPSYVLWTQVFKPVSIWVVPTLASCLLLHVFSLMIINKIVHFITFLSCSQKNPSEPWCIELYLTYQSFNYNFYILSMMLVFQGSPAFNLILRLSGVIFEGYAIVYTNPCLYEHSYITLEDKTIIDSSLIIGHYVVYDKITLGPCRVSGTLHRGTYVVASYLTSKESGPYHRFVGERKNDDSSNFAVSTLQIV